MKDLRDTKEAIVSYGINSAYLSPLLNIWSSRNRITQSDWLQLYLAVLEHGPQL